MFQYYGELSIGKYIESSYLMWKSEQHILTPKYEIFHSFVPEINHYRVTCVDYDNK